MLGDRSKPDYQVVVVKLVMMVLEHEEFCQGFRLIPARSAAAADDIGSHTS